MSVLTRKTTVVLVDDHKIVLDGLKVLLEREPDMLVCGLCATANEAVSVIGNEKPDIVVIDIGLESGANGIDLVKAVKNRYPNIRTLILSQNDEEIYAERALHAGAKGYVMKHNGTKMLLEAIRTVVRGELFYSESVRSKFLVECPSLPHAGSNPNDILSDREMEIFMLMSRGYKPLEIAHHMNLSVKTIDSHRYHMKEKFNMQSTNDVVKFAIEWAKHH